MNSISFQKLDIYEFFCDEELVDKVIPEVAGPDIIWTESKNDINGPEISRHGYLDKNDTPYYHPELFTWLQECVDKVAEKHYENYKLSIVDSWLTKNQFGNLSNFHLHNYSVISGLFYFSTFTKSKTIFVHEDPWHSHIPYMDFPNTLIKIAPEKGKLILWRSDIKHSIETHTDLKNTRYTLAFNTFFDDVISNYPTAKLKVKVNSVKDQYEEYMKKKAL